MKLYLLTATYGEYEMYEEVVVGVFTSLEQVEKAIEKAKKLPGYSQGIECDFDYNEIIVDEVDEIGFGAW